MGSSPDEITVLVAEAASEALETPIEELPPLSETVDLDALEALVPSTTASSPSDLTITFSYAGLHVVVCSGNTVYVQPAGRHRADSSEMIRFND